MSYGAGICEGHNKSNNDKRLHFIMSSPETLQVIELRDRNRFNRQYSIIGMMVSTKTFLGVHESQCDTQLWRGLHTYRSAKLDSAFHSPGDGK